MAENKSNGIKLHNIFLTKMDFEFFPGREQKKTAQLSINIETKFPEPTKLEESLTVNITSDEDPQKTDLRLAVTILGLFEEQQDGGPVTLEKFSTLQGPAILFPYIREVVMAITARSPIKAIVLQPMNLAALLKNGSGKTQI